MNPIPALDPATFTQLKERLQKEGAVAAVDSLAKDLEAAGDYHNLFYTLLMKKRVELKVSPFPTGASSELPPETLDPYENAIREAARKVGGLYLAKRDIPRAWGFFRLINEPEPIRTALQSYNPGPDEDIYPVIDIAWHQQVEPKKGFDLLLERHGICSAITTVSGTDLSPMPDVHAHCVGKLVRTLHEQLHERLRAELSAQGHAVSDSITITQMVQGHPELFGEDAYHVDVSHLSSVVQMALQLPESEEIRLASELCEYGQHLSQLFRGNGDSPFENNYFDYKIYLDILADRDVEAGLQHFEKKIPQELAEGNSFPAEIFVNLLLRKNRVSEALAASQKYLKDLPPDRGLSCPTALDLARRLQNYPLVSELGAAKGDAVTYLAGLIASEKSA